MITALLLSVLTSSMQRLYDAQDHVNGCWTWRCLPRIRRCWAKLALLFCCGIILRGHRVYRDSLAHHGLCQPGDHLRHSQGSLRHHLQRLPFSYYDSRPAGKILVRVINYVNSVSDILSNGIINTILEIITLVFIVVFMYSTDPTLATIVIAGLPLFVAVILYIKPRQRKAWQNQSNKNSNYNAYLAESIDGVQRQPAFHPPGGQPAPSWSGWPMACRDRLDEAPCTSATRSGCPAKAITQIVFYRDCISPAYTGWAAPS
ncbi:MAG: ABC transporter transmembrane domain-containing protein [Lachnospiraceae bacterium]